MSSEHNGKPFDVLDRATAAMRDMPIPDVPPEAMARTLAAIEQAERNPKPLRHERTFTMKFVTRFAAAAVLAVAMGGLAYWALWGNSVAFADVLERMKEVRTARFQATATVQLPNQPPQEVTVEGLLVEPARMRQTLPDGSITIFDYHEKKALNLNPKTRLAMLIEMENGPEEQMPPNLLEQFRKMDPKNAKPLGEKRLDGHDAVGFQVADGMQDLTVWVDKHTRLPVRVEMHQQIGALPASTVVMSDFEWNVPVDPAEVDLIPPPDYKLQTMKIDVSIPTERDLLSGLRTIAEMNNGVFPDRFDMSGLQQAAQSLGAAGEKLDETRMRDTLLQITRAMMFANNPANGEDWHYAGKDVKLGEKDRPILWYKPANTPTYRLIDAELNTHDVAVEDLPEPPAAEMDVPPAHAE